MKSRIEDEIRSLCKDQYLISKHYLKTETASNSLECRVFYFKIMADTFRYLATIETDKGKLEKLAEECSKRYRAAIIEASELEATNPIRLASGLNYSVFLAEIRFDFDGAIQTAQRVFDESLSIYSGLEKDMHSTTTRIMVLIKNNIEVWTLEQKHLHKIRELEQQKAIT